MNELKNGPAGWIALAMMLTLSGMQMNAQEFNAGLFGGMNASQVDRDGYGGYNKLGLSAGAFVNREIGSNFYWQLEIKYGGRGVYHPPDDNGEGFYKTSFHYIELPISLHYLHNEKIQGEIGLSPDVLISFSAYDEQRLKLPSDEKLGGNRRFGLNAFAGICYWVIPPVGVGLRFTYSAVPFYKIGESIRYLDSGDFHNVLSLTVTYKILHPGSGT
jgi:hypothetical protein